MTRVNRTLRRRGVEGLFCTLAYALFDFEEGTVTLANSGLPYPLHYRAREQRCAAVEIGGLPLGAFDSADVRGEDPAPSRPATCWSFIPTASPRHGSRADDDYGIARLGPRSRPTRPCPRPRSATRIIADVDRFLGGASRRRRDPGRGEGASEHGTERRRKPRFQVRVPVQLDRGAERFGPASRTSAGTPSWWRWPSALALGTEVALTLQLPGTGGPLQVVGLVVRVAPGEDGLRATSAVLFADVTPAAETRIDFFIALQGQDA